MMLKILSTFEYGSFGDFVKSLFPSLKYEHITLLTIGMSTISMFIDSVFGLDAFAFCGFLLILVVELVSGLWASRIKKVPFDSTKLSRFGFKCACYLVLIAVPYMMSHSYADHHQTLASDAFEWLHVFLVMQIIFENTVSILENIGMIIGKDKTFWIEKIQEKLKNVFA